MRRVPRKEITPEVFDDAMAAALKILRRHSMYIDIDQAAMDAIVSAWEGDKDTDCVRLGALVAYTCRCVISAHYKYEYAKKRAPFHPSRYTAIEASSHDFASDKSDVACATSVRDTDAVIDAEIRELVEGYVDPMVARYFCDGVRLTDIARSSGRKVGTVFIAIKRAKPKIREAYKAYAGI